MTSIRDLSHLTKIEFVCQQGKEEDRSANYWDKRRIFAVGGEPLGIVEEQK